MAKKEILIKDEHTLDDLTSVARTVRPIAKQILGNNGLMEMEILSGWTGIVGDELAKFTLPRRISFKKNERTNGILELLVLSGAFALEVQQREPQILEKINTFFGYTAITKLKIIQNSCPENFLLFQKPIDNLKNFLVSEEEQNYITEIVKDVESKDLRQHLENLGKAVFGCKKN